MLWCLHCPVAMTSNAQCGKSALSCFAFKSMTWWFHVLPPISCTMRNNKWSFQFHCLHTEAFPTLNKENNCSTHDVLLNPVVVRQQNTSHFLTHIRFYGNSAAYPWVGVHSYCLRCSMWSPSLLYCRLAHWSCFALNFFSFINVGVFFTIALTESPHQSFLLLTENVQVTLVSGLEMSRDTCSDCCRYFPFHQRLQPRMASGFPRAGKNTVGEISPLISSRPFSVDAHERQEKLPLGFPFAWLLDLHRFKTSLASGLCSWVT